MPSLLKSTVLGLGLLAGVAAAADAQSVSSLPPTGGATAPTTPPAVTSSTQSVFPKPGGQALFQEGHYQAPADWDFEQELPSLLDLDRPQAGLALVRAGRALPGD
jgi:hypothetical protein